MKTGSRLLPLNTLSNVYPHSEAEQKLCVLFQLWSWTDWTITQSSKELHSPGGGEKVQRPQSVAHKNKASSIYTEPKPKQ